MCCSKEIVSSTNKVILWMDYRNGEETNTKHMQRKTPKIEHNNGKPRTQDLMIHLT